jgi:hypothetical protein
LKLRRCRPLILATLVPVAAFSLLAAGCGGGSPGVASVTTSTSPATTNGALAFARCLRSHGLPGWPDPDSSGHFDKATLRQLPYSESRVRAVEDGPCNHLLGGSSQGPTITPADRVDYLRAAGCMRSHGVPNFPDPTFQNGSVQTNIPSTIDQDSSQFKSAAASCTTLIPAGLPYSTAPAP